MVGSHRHLGVTPRFRFFKQLTVGNNHLSLAAQAKLAMALGYKKTREPQPSGSHTEVAVSVHALAAHAAFVMLQFLRKETNQTACTSF